MYFSLKLGHINQGDGQSCHANTDPPHLHTYPINTQSLYNTFILQAWTHFCHTFTLRITLKEHFYFNAFLLTDLMQANHNAPFRSQAPWFYLIFIIIPNMYTCICLVSNERTIHRLVHANLSSIHPLPPQYP